MRLNAFIEGLETLRKYYNDANGFHIGAEHDQFYAYATDKPMTDDDVALMRALDWFQPDADEDANGEFIYAHDEGWSAFT